MHAWRTMEPTSNVDVLTSMKSGQTWWAHMFENKILIKSIIDTYNRVQLYSRKTFIVNNFYKLDCDE